MKLKVGDKVRKNAETWKPNEFDGWGRGEGIGVVIEPPFPVDDIGCVDVKWPCGRCFEEIKQIIKVDEEELEKLKMNYKEINELAKNIDANLLSTDKRFSKSVFIRHQDGSVMMFEYAFVERLIDDEYWYLIFTEHHGFRVYNSEDIDVIHQYEECEIFSVDINVHKEALAKKDQPSRD